MTIPGITKNKWNLLCVLCICIFITSNLRKSMSLASILWKDPSNRNLSKTDLGAISSSFSLGYGISKLICGFLSDIFPANILLFIGMFCGSILYMIFPWIASYSFSISSIFWLNLLFFASGITLGVSTPTLSKLISDVFYIHEIGKVWSLITVAGNLGYMFAPFIVFKVHTILENIYCFSKVDCYNEIQFISFYIIGCIGVLLSIGLILSLQRIGSSTNDRDNNQKVNSIKESKFIWIQCFQNITIWNLMISNLLATFTLKAIGDWSSLYLSEYLGYSLEISSRVMFFSEVAGIVGTICVGTVTEWFDGNMSFTCLVFGVGFVITTILLQYYIHVIIYPLGNHDVNIWVVNLSICLGFFINGPKTILSVVIQQFVPHEISGSLNGINGIIGQLGGWLAGYFLGYMIDTFGWESFLSIMAISMMLMSFLVIYPLIRYRYDQLQQQKSKNL